MARPRRVLWIGFLVAVLGWIAATQLHLDTDYSQLAPSSSQSSLERASGSSGQVSVLVHGDDLADPKAIAWMSDYQQRVLKRHGYTERRPCRDAQLCPGLSVTNLFTGGPPRTRQQAEAVFRSLPRYFSQNVITSDRRTASMAFGLGSMSAGDRKKVIDDMRDQLNPPPGVRAELAGLPVTAAETRSGDAGQWWLALGAILAIFIVLLVAYRSVEEALVPLTPVALAPFWAAPVLLLLDVPINPLSAGLWALAMALIAGFSVLVAAVYRVERETDTDRQAVVAATYRRSRPVALGAAATVLVAFGVLIFSGVDVLADFGLAAVLDLTVALGGTMLLLPASLALAEEGMGLPRTRAGARAAARSAASRARLGLGAAARGVRASAPFRK